MAKKKTYSKTHTVPVPVEEYRRLCSLEKTVRKVLAQRGDSVCWRDLYTELAKLVGVNFCPQLFVSKDHMMANCSRFIDSLQSGPYTPLYTERKDEAK